MKKRIFIYLSVIMTLGVLLSSCGETDIEKANSEYDWDAVVPSVLGTSGPDAVYQTFSDVFAVTYDRGGSTWTWAVNSVLAIDSLSDDTRTAYISFPNDGAGEIYVSETAANGLTSEVDTIAVTVFPFCPMTRDDFLGSWTGSEIGSSDVDPLTVTFVAGPNADEIMIEATAGTPGILSAVYTGWTETFQAGFGIEGDIILRVLENGSVEIDWTYWGQTLPGPYDYWYWGSGLWDGCNETLDFDFNMDWSGDASSPASNRYGTVSLTKD